MSSAETRILHLHIPKTAGTALRTALEVSGKTKLSIYPEYDESRYKNVNPNDYDVFSGHYGYETAARLGGRIVTVLREPIDRFVSVYYFWRQLHKQGVERNRKTALAVNYNLHEFSKLRDEPVLVEEFYNRATWQLAHGSSMAHRAALHDQGVTEARLLKQAKTNLAGFAIVGFQDDLAPFDEALGELAGINLTTRRVNVTRDRPAFSEISLGTQNQIRSWVYLDIDLYREVRGE